MAIGDRLRERRAKRRKEEITPAQERETNVPVEQESDMVLKSPYGKSVYDNLTLTGGAQPQERSIYDTLTLNPRISQDNKDIAKQDLGTIADGIISSLAPKTQNPDASREPEPDKSTSDNDKILTFSEFAGNPEEFIINFAKRNPEPDITEGLNFFKSGNYTVPAEALNYFGKELDDYLKSRNIPEEDRERIKKKIRRTRIADALMKTANIIGQTVAVAKGGTPVPINGRPVLQNLKDQTERRQKEWERELEYALQNDKALNTRAYSDYLQRMMDDRKSARDAELKRDIAGQNYDLGLKKLESQERMAQWKNEAAEIIAQRRNETSKQIAAMKSKGEGGGGRSSGNKTYRIVVNSNTYDLTKEDADIIVGYISEYLRKMLSLDPEVFDEEGNFLGNRYNKKLEALEKTLKGNTEQLLGDFAVRYPEVVEDAIQYLQTGGEQGRVGVDDEEIQIGTFE